MNTENTSANTLEPWSSPRALWRFIFFVFRQFLAHSGMENAKSLTYMSLFAVVPLLTLILAILSAFPSFQVFGSQIQGMIFDRLLPASSSELEVYITEFSSQAKNLTWIGAVMLLATAYLMLVNVERSFNRIWDVAQLRKGIASFLLYWSVLSLSPLLLGVGFAISSYITSLSLFEKFTEVSDSVGARSLVLSLFPTVLTTIAFTLLYVAVPNCGVRLRHGFTGGLVVALLFIVVKWVFGKFIATASYEFVYGTFAAIPIFLMWLYLCWVVILFGANLVRAIPVYRIRTSTRQLHPSLLIIALLHKFWQHHQQGVSVTVRELLENDWAFHDDLLGTSLEFLQEKKIIRTCGEGEYILNRELDSISLWQLLQSMPWGLPGGSDFIRKLPEPVVSHLPDAAWFGSTFKEIEGKAQQAFSLSLAAYFRKEASPGDGSDSSEA